jgi:hypothetical protein
MNAAVEFLNKFNVTPMDVPSHGVPRLGRSTFENPKNWVNVDNLPPSDATMDYDAYVRLCPNFVDPYPSNVVEHDGVLVVRDDLIPRNLGSKARFAEALMQTVKETYIFYGMPAHGQALKVLAASAKKYGKTVVGISPLRNNPTECHLEAIQHGAVVLYFQTGGMSGVRKRCRAFINDHLQNDGVYIPIGVKHPLIISGFAQSVRKIYDEYRPDVIFSVASTMTMSHGLQLGAPSTCEIFAVQVAGNSATKKWPGRAHQIYHPQPFSEPCPRSDLPPFNSIPEYDAKGWKYALEYARNNPSKRVMFWNVAGAHNINDNN